MLTLLELLITVWDLKRSLVWTSFASVKSDLQYKNRVKYMMAILEFYFKYS